MTAQTDVLVRFRDVQKSYDGETLVVRDLDLDIYRGEFLTLLGPSGSGKTTTLMMLAGFEAPTGGEISLEGRLLGNLPPYKRDLGIVFQNYALFPHMTVRENVAFPLKVRRKPSAEVAEEVDRALAMVRLSDFGNRRPGQLSGGQQQRIALARALVFRPKLVLMDEPLGALDKKLREQMQFEIKHIHANLGVTVVYVTHDQAEALTMSDRIAVFNEGVVQQLATPKELYERPRNAFVAQFIGENNRLPGTVVDLNDAACTVTVAGGATVEALPVNVAESGARTTLSLRPERVVIGPKTELCENVFEATVAELVYIGDHIRARVDCLGHDDFIVKVPNSLDTPDLRPGARIRIGWRRQDCAALDAS